MDFLLSVGITTPLYGVLLGLLIYTWYNFRKNHYWKRNNIQCEPPLPFFGNYKGLLLGKTYFQLELQWYKKYGRIFGAYGGSTPILFVADPELLRQILVKDFNALQDRVGFSSTDEVVSSFLTTLTGDTWKRVRSVITPAFSNAKMKKMIPLVNDTAEIAVESLLTAADSDMPTDCKRYFGAFVLDVVATIAFGTKLNSARDPENEFVKNAREIFNTDLPLRFLVITFVPKLAKLLKTEPFKASVIQFFIDFTNDVVKRRKMKNEIRNDFLQVLMDAQNSITEPANLPAADVENSNYLMDQENLENQHFFKDFYANQTISQTEFIAQCVLFLLASYDTTSTTLSMAAYFLALNPECQKELVQEVDRTWEKHPEPSYEVLGEMKYLDAVICETLRMAPPGTRLERKAVEDYKFGNTGIVVTKDMIVAVPVYAMHHDPDFFPNPEEFMPERFFPENRNKIIPYTYLPFGSGPRNCVGQRLALVLMKICLLHVLRLVTFQTCSANKIPLEFYKGIGLFHPKEVMLKVVRRNKAST